jgi:Ca2+-binding RTX toxin-like protein
MSSTIINYGDNNNNNYSPFAGLEYANYIMYGYGGDDTLTGGYVNDTLYGGTGNDVLSGREGYDYLYGEDGNDTLIDTDGYIDGGAGIDTLVADYSQFNNGAGIYMGYNQQNIIASRLNNNTLLSYSNVEKFNITGTQYNDILQGGSGDDTLNGGGGFDQIIAGAGNDIVIDTVASIDGGAGVDTLVADYSQFNNGSGIEVQQNGVFNRQTGSSLLGHINIEQFNITGTQYDDILRGGSGYDTLNGGAGNDILIDTNGTVDGGVGNDTLIADYSAKADGNGVHLGWAGTDHIYNRVNGYSLVNFSNVENFNITGTQYSDAFEGRSGNDIFNGGAGSDELYGAGGDDILNPGYSLNSTDIVDGGTGNDTLVVDYSAKTDGAGVHLGWLGTNNVFNRVNGQALVNVSNVENYNITGTQYDDVFEGRAGNDIFSGGAGNDYLDGAAGNDILVGGFGYDILRGGSGADKFVFNSVSEGMDLIKDFSWQEGDKIQINGASFGATSTQQFSFDTLTGTLSFNGQQFAVLENISNASDFIPAYDIVIV